MSAAGTTAARPKGAGRAVRAALAAVRRQRRRLAALAAVAVVMVAGYLLWLRDSSLVEVRAVTVTGLAGSDSERIRAALESTARNMTTLHVDRGKLERAASAFPVVRALEVKADFPHGMRIHVLQEVPAAVLASGTRRVAVAADGTILTGLAVPAGLPLIRVSGAMPRLRVAAAGDRARVAVAAGVPAGLRPRLQAVRHERGRGVVALMRDGPKLIFGDAARVAAKWAAAAGVLADRDAAGADYVDVRIPERPAAGGLPVATVAPVAPAQAPATPAATPDPATPAAAQAAPAPSQPTAQGPAGAATPPATARPPGTGASPPPAAPVTPGGGATPDPQP